MKLAFSYLLAFTAIAVSAHDEHDHDMQMPLDYVKFPYQAVYYPGDNEGMSLSSTARMYFFADAY